MRGYPIYNLLTNNCVSFILRVLNQICKPGFMLALAIAVDEVVRANLNAHLIGITVGVMELGSRGGSQQQGEAKPGDAGSGLSS